MNKKQNNKELLKKLRKLQSDYIKKLAILHKKRSDILMKSFKNN